MAKEFFKAHFFPEQFGRRAWFTNSLNYYLAALFFNAFPLPQREAGTRQTLRYIGDLLTDGWSVLIFPEGRRSDDGSVTEFRPGIGMIGVAAGRPGHPGQARGTRPCAAPLGADGDAGSGPFGSRSLRGARGCAGRRLRSARQIGGRRGAGVGIDGGATALSVWQSLSENPNRLNNLCHNSRYGRLVA